MFYFQIEVVFEALALIVIEVAKEKECSQCDQKLKHVIFFLIISFKELSISDYNIIIFPFFNKWNFSFSVGYKLFLFYDFLGNLKAVFYLFCGLPLSKFPMIVLVPVNCDVNYVVPMPLVQL